MPWNPSQEGVSRPKLNKDRMRRNAIIREFEIIGEAVKNLPLDFTLKYPHIEWAKIAGLRDKLIHHYFGIELDIVLGIIKQDLPRLKKDIKEILEKEA